MTAPVPPARTAQALKVRRDRSRQKIEHIGEALERVLKARTAITVAA
ncbi:MULTISPECIES: hypothetical protein [unclassified Streptomyces]|nr:hypothetical protein [Streptomyces sp. SJL17-1]